MNEGINVQIETKDGINVVSSRVIAKELGKQHKNVKRDLEKILEEMGSNLSVPQIIKSEYKDSCNRTQTEYLLTKDGFTLYMFNIQGYNNFKMAYINEFNRMEKVLQQKQPSYEIADPIERAKRWIEEETIRQEQAKQLEEQKPLVQFATQVTNSSDCIDIGQFAKIIKDEKIKMGRNLLFAWLRENRYLMDNNNPYQKYIDNNYFKVIEVTKTTAYGPRTYTKTLITGKGQVYILEKLRGLFS